MEAKNKYNAPYTDVIKIVMEGMIAVSSQLEKPEEGGDFDPWI